MKQGNDRGRGRHCNGRRNTPKLSGKPSKAEQLSFWQDLFPDAAAKDCPPAAGYRNNSSLNNAGSNGNYWSSTLNENNSNNARNLNFNSSNHNTNNNNRYNGQSVRSVTALTRTQLLADLYVAYRDARRHKRSRDYQLKFEINLEEMLCQLCDELQNGTYRPGVSSAFIVYEPKQREVFAAEFRDRVVHHLYYNYTHELFERTFIQDTYSCIKGRGTHYGADRLEKHIRQESHNYTRPCYVLKMDIQGYFININRRRLLEVCLDTLEHMRCHKSDKKGMTWGEVLDYDFIRYLTEVIVLYNPLEDYRFRAQRSDWEGLPKNKSLFYADADCGLPIGNLTSQLFSNVYLNRLDQFVKRELKCRHYGRYVDDFYIVSSDKEYLRTLIPQIQDFLSNELSLSLHQKKTKIYDAYNGIEFLGQFILPYRRYCSNRSLDRIKRGLDCIRQHNVYDEELLLSQVNSYLGILGHTRSHRQLMQLVRKHRWIFRFGCFVRGWNLFKLYQSSAIPNH